MAKYWILEKRPFLGCVILASAEREGLSQKQVDNILEEFSNFGNIAETTKAQANHAVDFEVPLYRAREEITNVRIIFCALISPKPVPARCARCISQILSLGLMRLFASDWIYCRQYQGILMISQLTHDELIGKSLVSLQFQGR